MPEKRFLVIRALLMIGVVLLAVLPVLGQTAEVRESGLDPRGYIPIVFQAGDTPTFTPTPTTTNTPTPTNTQPPPTPTPSATYTLPPPTPTFTPAPPTPTFTPAPPTPTNTATSTTIPEAVVELAFLEYDPPGDDVDGEFVAIENIGGTAADMTDWVLSDDDSNSFIFPSFTLQPGALVMVRTKAGTNTATDLYWGSAVEIWDNTGDTATLRDNNAQLIDMCSYPGGGQNTAC